MPRVLVATTAGVFVALCLFGGLVWLIFAIKARAAAAELQKELEAQAIVLQRQLEAQATFASAAENVAALEWALELYAMKYDGLPPLHRWQEALKAEEERSLAELAASN